MKSKKSELLLMNAYNFLLLCWRDCIKIWIIYIFLLVPLTYRSFINLKISTSRWLVQVTGETSVTKLNNVGLLVVYLDGLRPNIIKFLRISNCPYTSRTNTLVLYNSEFLSYFTSRKIFIFPLVTYDGNDSIMWLHNY